MNLRYDEEGVMYEKSYARRLRRVSAALLPRIGYQATEREFTNGLHRMERIRECNEKRR
jgi:hypothetical protein